MSFPKINQTDGGHEIIDFKPSADIPRKKTNTVLDEYWQKDIEYYPYCGEVMTPAGMASPDKSKPTFFCWWDKNGKAPQSDNPEFNITEQLKKQTNERI